MSLNSNLPWPQQLHRSIITYPPGVTVNFKQNKVHQMLAQVQGNSYLVQRRHLFGFRSLRVVLWHQRKKIKIKSTEQEPPHSQSPRSSVGEAQCKGLPGQASSPGPWRGVVRRQLTLWLQAPFSRVSLVTSQDSHVLSASSSQVPHLAINV